MDRLIKRWDSKLQGALRVCEHRGVAYQADMRVGRKSYDDSYFAAYQSLSGSPVELALNNGRCALLARHAPANTTVIDIGIGNGSFVRAALAQGFQAMGHDINPAAVAWLQAEGLFSGAYRDFDALTLWDSLEHMENPEVVLKRVRRGAIMCVAIPVMKDILRVHESKHYKPGEHLYYWTAQGFIDWMALYGFRLLEQSSHETDAGREAIAAFAFCRDLPTYGDHISAYSQIHSSRHYGNSATELHLGAAASIVRSLKPKSILDYGCGRSDLVAHFWRDGERKIARYDPAIPPVSMMPLGTFDLAFVCDVMEHIPMADVDRVLSEVREKSPSAFFTISTKLARAKLPDGRNSHVTILRHSEWVRWIRDVFGATQTLGATSEFELVLLAGPREIEERRAA